MEDFIKNLTNMKNLTRVVTPPTLPKQQSNNSQQGEAGGFATSAGIFNRASGDYQPNNAVGFNISYRDNKGRSRAGLLVVDKASARRWAKGENPSLDIYGAELDDGSSLDFNGVMRLMQTYDKKPALHLTSQEDFLSGENYTDMDDYDSLRIYREVVFPTVTKLGQRRGPYLEEPLSQVLPSFIKRLRDTYKR